jgi:hypothetical protein
VLEPVEWLIESSELAASHVNTPEFLGAMGAVRRIGTGPVETMDFPGPYLKTAGAVAQKRAAIAAWRPVVILNEDLKWSRRRGICISINSKHVVANDSVHRAVAIGTDFTFPVLGDSGSPLA